MMASIAEGNEDAYSLPSWHWVRFKSWKCDFLPVSVSSKVVTLFTRTAGLWWRVDTIRETISTARPQLTFHFIVSDDRQRWALSWGILIFSMHGLWAFQNIKKTRIRSIVFVGYWTCYLLPQNLVVSKPMSAKFQSWKIENTHSELAETSRNLRIGPVVDSESPFEFYRIWPKSGFILGQILQIHPTKLANALFRTKT